MRRKALALLCFHVLSSPANAFCTALQNNTWAAFVEAVSESLDYGFAFLCPFEITGKDCPSYEDYPDGLAVSQSSDHFLICDPFLYGYDVDSECIIDCPGRHFTVDGSSQLTVERFTLSGATNSSIKVEEGGSLKLFNSIVINNAGIYGGAIHGGSNSIIDIEYSQFFRNTASYGGSMYGSQDCSVEVTNSIFEENIASIAGGAIATEVWADAKFDNTKFHRNEAASGGAMYLAEYSNIGVFSSDFEGNVAINGGALYNSGFLDIYNANFKENYAEDSGGALYIDAGSRTLLQRNHFISNEAQKFGPAVNNQFNMETNISENTGCGNVARSTNKVQCDGIFNFGTGQCQPFDNECEVPTTPPAITASPSAASSFAPSIAPTIINSEIPSDLPSLVPSTVLGSSSEIPSDLPSLIPSQLPTRSV